MGWRTARLCAHETYVDCPYYEQYQYVGDTRIQALLSYDLTGDDRLARQAIAAFERSRRSEGLTSSRSPAREPQYIPPFSLLWIGMVRDFWRYRGRSRFVRAQLAGTRTVLEWFLERQLPNGLVGRLPWWNFVDWAPEFDEGVPPQETDGQSAPITLQLVAALRDAAELETALGDPGRAPGVRRRAQLAAGAVGQLCWDEGRGLVADRPSKDRFSQHTNILAILSDAIPRGRHPRCSTACSRRMPFVRAAGDPACSAAGDRREGQLLLPLLPGARAREARRGDEYLPQLEPWREMLEWASRPGPRPRRGHLALRLPRLERAPELRPAHARGRDPPGAPGFASVRIEPHLGTLERFAARMPHPSGTIEASYRRVGAALEATITLPPGLAGDLAWRGTRRPLRSGEQAFRVE